MKTNSYLALCLLPALLLLSGCGSSLSVDKLLCNNQDSPVGIEGRPVFRWTLTAQRPDAEATAYEIRLEKEEGERRKEEGGWSSGKVKMEGEVWIEYAGPGLLPATGYEWKVRVWDEKDRPSAWSREGRFVTGLPDDQWKDAQWIGYESLDDSLRLVPGVHGSGDQLGSHLAVRRPVIPRFRKEFDVRGKASEAYLFISGLGHYTLTVDGERPDERFLAPGWTNYARTCLYNGYDLTEKLNRGGHTIGITVGNGFFNINRERYRKLVTSWGRPMMRLVLVIRYADGTVERLVSDEAWKTAPSPIVFASIYGGEDYDARLEQLDWTGTGFNDSGWQPAMVVRGPGGMMEWESDYPLMEMQSFRPVKTTRLADSSYVYDFGQNASGLIEVRVTGGAGQTFRITPGELIRDDGSINQDASGGPMYYEITTDGRGTLNWKPKFNYYGLRYAGVSGAVPAGESNPGHLPVVESIIFHHTRNSSPAVGTFHCSNKLFNRIHNLIDWAIRSNLASVTTDCPHREKLGWLEQTHLVGNSIRCVYEVHNLYAKIVDDMIESQLDNGLVPDIAPEYVPFQGGFRDSPEWGSSCVIVPWYLYEWYGDRKPMEKAWDMMNRYVDYLDSLAVDHILSHGLGDWFDMGPGPMGEAQLTPRSLTATAIWFYDLKLLSQMAAILGKKQEAASLAARADTVKAAFIRTFYNPETYVISTGSQTAYAMPLVTGLVPEEDRQAVFANLVRTVEQDKYVLTAGDVGYRYLVSALQDAGASDVIWKMNCRDDVPGYGYQLRHGATALTESWAALREVSNNHMMLGHLMEWLYSGIGGIRQAPGSIGFNHVVIDPQPVGDLTFADVSHTCIHGKIRVHWQKTGQGVEMEVTIPAGVKADVFFGGKKLGTFGAGTRRFAIANE